MGTVDAIEGACVLCGRAFKMTEPVEQQVCFKLCIKLEHSSVETIWMIQKTSGDDAMNAAHISVIQMLQSWLRIC